MIFSFLKFVCAGSNENPSLGVSWCCRGTKGPKPNLHSEGGSCSYALFILSAPRQDICPWFSFYFIHIWSLVVFAHLQLLYISLFTRNPGSGDKCSDYDFCDGHRPLLAGNATTALQQVQARSQQMSGGSQVLSFCYVGSNVST